MKSKIKYSDIPKNVLNIVVGESYGLGDYTLKDELDKYGEDIIFARYELHTKNDIKWFQCWTKNYVMVLLDSGLGDQCVLGLLREVPEKLIGIGEFNGRSKEKRKRTSSSNSKANKR